MASQFSVDAPSSEVIERLSRKLIAKLKESKEDKKRIVIGISGVPGAGIAVTMLSKHCKTTLARNVSNRINELHIQEAGGDSTPIAVDLPMDGFHYSREHLAGMPNPTEAIHRRGAAFTFDAPGFLALVQDLVAQPASNVLAPSFDHAVKDPVVAAITVPPTARIVLVEGNYCNLNRTPWSDAAALMDELWYVDTPAEVAHSRLAKRHLASGIVADEKEAWERATGTDELNAQDVRKNRLPSDETIITN